ncbi:MAG: NAD-dependent epimerase/dehydratase family protein [Bacteroidetes bacterium]|nr:NAD-dependent epimerase/dehydratase family protein [Bacteroidota bacterium]MBS1908958.1 NAD-dependent epimerase/dehydratase family protein [Bacteroidota bacterium]MBS1925591.1 NAD-dependent epimerase/dehydratase family protein [Bacteroidota bacterium]
MRIEKILITGGAGFIGSALSLHLIEKGYKVNVLDNLSEQIHGKNTSDSPLYKTIKDKVNFIHGTVTSKTDWLKAIQDCDAIVHLAAETGTGQSMYKINDYVSVNIGGTALMLDILTNEKHKIKKVIIASSRAIYGEGKYVDEAGNFVYPESRSDEDLLQGKFEPTYKNAVNLKLVATDEDSVIHPTSVYGITKQNQEQMVMTVCSALGIDATAFRYQNVYGPGQSLRNPYTGILSIFSSLINSGKEVNIFEDGKESRDFVFISDVVAATTLGIENDNARGQVFNVGSGVATTVLQVAQTLCKHYEKMVPLKITGNYRLGDIRHNYADISKIKSILGFIPLVHFEEGIRQFADWVKQQEVNASGYELSLEEMRSKGLLK